MRFELSVAFNYLLPRARKLSSSIISLVSILVISLVVWLVVVFLSVTHGIEKTWTEELVAINAPLRITPTDAYYKSYYYLIDSLSEKSNYTLKTLGEKLASKEDPYDPTFDASLPASFPQNEQKHIVHELHDVLTGLKLKPEEFEVTFSNMQLELYRENELDYNVVNQLCYLSSYDNANDRLKKLILPPSVLDEVNLKHTLAQNGLDSDNLLPFCVFPEKNTPPKTALGTGILISDSFQKHGVLLGDRGFLAYLAPSASSVKEQRMPIYVAGFYNPGVMPIGNRVVFATPDLLTTMRGQLSIPDDIAPNGYNIYFNDLEEAPLFKEKIELALKEKGVDSYFKVESFVDYEFAKPVLEQLKSDKMLFTLIAIIILVVACSNIISMLILLVNDKKKEIGILQSMGVSTKQIGVIFGLCGFLTGVISSALGTLAAIATLHNLQSLINFLSFMQGREAFQSMFYGKSLPNELSMNALAFVLSATAFISILAGIVPAIKACRIKPAAILRSE